MSNVDAWVARIQALPNDEVEVLRLLSEGKDEAAIGEETDMTEQEVRECIFAVCKTLDLGPFTAPEEVRKALGEIYCRYCAPGTPATTEAEKPPKEGQVRKKPSNGGVVIEIPSDTTGIDVLTGPVHDEGLETAVVSKAIKERIEQGFKPAYLVLTPSAVDPALTNFRLIFFERG